ncbi:MAG: T9SS type A sorting domain-containing protein [Bacteroidetes bacterium]|nr:T9SS type A sorting domain-containing protein [Bacteroidota bacterium]
MCFTRGDSALISSPYYSGSHMDFYYLKFSPDTTTGIADFHSHKNSELSLHPNPSTGDFDITAKPGEHLREIQILNLEGICMKRFTYTTENNAHLHFDEKGFYLLKTETDLGVYVNRVLVVY